MDVLEILLALHAPGECPELEAALRARGVRIATSHNLADTWIAARDGRPDAILLVPLTRQASSAELQSLMALAETPEGPALLVLTSQPAFLEDHGERIDDFLAPEDPVDLVLRRLRFTVARRAALRRLHRERESLLEQTTTDFKTGLRNDRAFHERCRIECARATRESRPLAILMLDLDEFKAINDEHDHPFGDYVLQQLAAVFTRCLRPFDTAARMGGDEFAVLLPNTDLEAAAGIAERLRATVEELEPAFGGHSARVSITIGVAAWDSDSDEDFEETVRQADQALLAAKRLGRNRVGIHKPPATKGKAKRKPTRGAKTP